MVGIFVLLLLRMLSLSVAQLIAVDLSGVLPSHIQL